jgi:hypothetical protein
MAIAIVTPQPEYAGDPNYVCLSTDVLPVTAVSVGETAYYTDTNVTQIFNGSSWVPYIVPNVSGSLVLATGSAVIGKARLVDSGGTEVTETTFHSLKVYSQFAGTAYSNTHTQVSDAEYRFESSSKKLSTAYIQVTTQSQLVGATGTEAYTQTAAAAPMILQNVDLSTLYFKNASAGQNGTINIVGTLI